MTEILQELDGEILNDVTLLLKDPLLNFTDSSWNACEHHMVSPIPKTKQNRRICETFAHERSIAGDSHIVQQTSGSSLR